MFIQRPIEVERTCEVKVSALKTHAIQTGTSVYRLLTAEPTQLVTECHSGTHTTLVDGVHMVNLSDECPRASTPDFVFTRTPSLYHRHELIKLPLLEHSRRWLSEVSQELNAVAVRESVEWYLNGSTTMSLPAIRSAIENRQHQMYSTMYSYIQGAAVGAILLFFMWKGFEIILCRCVRGCIRGRADARRRGSYHEPRPGNDEGRDESDDPEEVQMRRLAVPYRLRGRHA